MSDPIYGTFGRTIRKFLKSKGPMVCDSACWFEGKIHRIVSSKHLTPSGRRYSRLIKFRHRLGKKA